MKPKGEVLFDWGLSETTVERWSGYALYLPVSPPSTPPWRRMGKRLAFAEPPASGRLVFVEGEIGGMIHVRRRSYLHEGVEHVPVDYLLDGQVVVAAAVKVADRGIPTPGLWRAACLRLNGLFCLGCGHTEFRVTPRGSAVFSCALDGRDVVLSSVGGRPIASMSNSHLICTSCGKQHPRPFDFALEESPGEMIHGLAGGSLPPHLEEKLR